MSGKTTGPDSDCLAINQPRETLRSRLLSPPVFTMAYVLFAMGCCATMAFAAWLQYREREAAARITRLRAFVSRLCRWYLEYHSFLGVVSIAFLHQRRLGPGLIVANHPSLVDALWILATQPHACCVLKGDLQNSWLFRYLVTELNYVSNSDPERLLAEGSERLRNGETLLVFPEATRTEPRALPEFRLGAAELVVRTGACVHPVVIFKTGSYLSKSRAWYKFPRRVVHWWIGFSPSTRFEIGESPRQARRQITTDLQRYFHQRLRAGVVAPEWEPAEN